MTGFGELAKAFEQKRELRETSHVLGLIDAAVRKKGGIEKFGEELVADYDEARESGNAHLTHKYHALLQKYVSERDRVSGETSDLSNVDEDDLKAVVTEIAVDLLVNDSDFRQRCLDEAERRRAEQKPIPCQTS